MSKPWKPSIMDQVVQDTMFRIMFYLDKPTLDGTHHVHIDRQSQRPYTYVYIGGDIHPYMREGIIRIEGDNMEMVAKNICNDQLFEQMIIAIKATIEASHKAVEAGENYNYTAIELFSRFKRKVNDDQG